MANQTRFIEIEIDSKWYPVDITVLRVGVVITALRRSEGIELEELSAKIGRGPQYMNRIERGIVQAKLVDYLHIADALNVRRADLFARAEKLNWKKTRAMLEASGMIVWAGGTLNPKNPNPKTHVKPGVSK